MDREKMITTKEFAETVGAVYSTVMRWVKDGRIPGAELVEESRGAVWYIPRSAISGFEKPERGRPKKEEAPIAVVEKPAAKNSAKLPKPTKKAPARLIKKGA